MPLAIIILIFGGANEKNNSQTSKWNQDIKAYNDAMKQSSGDNS